MAISDKDFYASHGLKYDREKMLEDYINKKITEALEEIEHTMKNKRDNFFTSHKLIERGYEFAVNDLEYAVQKKIKALEGDE